MSTVYIQNVPCTLLASVRRAGLPYEGQDGNLIAIDYQQYDGGGMSNVRFTREQAIALRDALFAFFQREPREVTIGKHPDGKLMQQEQP